jgi:hypothetical protein
MPLGGPTLSCPQCAPSGPALTPSASWAFHLNVLDVSRNNQNFHKQQDKASPGPNSSTKPQSTK